MIEKGIRGGVSMIPMRYAKANNKYMGEKFNPDEHEKYIQYVDAGSLYGWAISQLLPVGNFKWMSEKEIEMEFKTRSTFLTKREKVAFLRLIWSVQKTNSYTDFTTNILLH